MTSDSTDTLSDDELASRLHTTFSTVMPLLDTPVRDPGSASPDANSNRVVDVALLESPASHVSRRPVMWLAGAAAVLLIVIGLGSTLFDRVDSPVSDLPPPSASPSDPDSSTAVNDSLPPVSTIYYELAEPMVSTIPDGSNCSIPSPSGCEGYARLAVSPEVSSFYVGPAELGTPLVDIDGFDQLVRCVEHDAIGKSCLELEGFAGVGVGSYPSDITPDTSGTSSSESLVVFIGTTFARITPGEYADQWQSPPEQADPNREDVVVRGQPGVAFDYFDRRSVVWNERPGVLVWVTVPVSRTDELFDIAEGVRSVPGPSSIPWIVAVPDDLHGQVYDAGSNDSDNLLVGRREDGAECVGFGYIESACDGAINAQTFVQFIDERALITGLAPSNVVQVRFTQNNRTRSVTSTQPVDATDSLLFSEFVDADGVITVEWLDADGVIVGSTDVTIDPCDIACG